MALYLSRVKIDAEETEQWIRLPEESGVELRLGRSSDSSVRLLSPHISRNHGLLAKREDGTYAIKDQKSLNGIHINDKKIPPDCWEQLSVGDTIEIGRPEEEDVLKALGASDRFIYTVKACSCSELDAKQPGPKQHLSDLMKKVKPQKPAVKITESATAVAKKNHRTDPAIRTAATENKRSFEQTVTATVCPDNRKPGIPAKVFPPRNSEPNEEMIQENKRLKLELEEKQQELLKEIELRDKKLEEQQAKLAKEFEKSYKNQLERKEEELEMRLQLEKDLALEQCTTSSTKDEKPTKAMKSVVDAMENELQCSVCSELFIFATTLNCSHTFCQFCIKEWQKVKSICPVCRTPILTVTRSLVLDNYIDKVLESLSNELRENRAKLIKERKKIVADRESAAKARSNRRGGRTRGHGRGGRRQNRGRGYGVNSGVRTRSTVIVISDPESSDTSSDDDESDSSDDSYSSSFDGHYFHELAHFL